MKLDAKRRGQYVMKREQRGMFKISSRTKIKPKDDVICRIEESISVTEWSQSLNQTPRSTVPVFHHMLFPLLQTVDFHCVFVCGQVKGLQKALMTVIAECGLALPKHSTRVSTACKTY